MPRITLVLLSVITIFLVALLALKALAAAMSPRTLAAVVRVDPTLQRAGTGETSLVASTEAPDWSEYCAGHAGVRVVSGSARGAGELNWAGPACGPGVHASYRPWQTGHGAPAAVRLDRQAGWWSYFASWDALATSTVDGSEKGATAWFIPGVTLPAALAQPAQVFTAGWATGKPEQVCAGQPLGVKGLGDTGELPPGHPVIPVSGPAVIYTHQAGDRGGRYVYALAPGQQDSVTLPGRVWVYPAACARYAEIDKLIVALRLVREDPARQLLLAQPPKG